ncbi:hypothetical protein EJB05_09146 [Eragrostis curvula]|uniref:F-box domain-containing protein n=1 Tax=Eragrostis curvula TaxID=38414 RepID=A0A5J9W466_9POAL|nr:hypothetical protein EJB05_09146 [Eragrostis curvula]
MMDKPSSKSSKAMAFLGDRISSLPDELLHHVMSFLPAMDTVRTCVLSTRWRHLWATVRCINIDAKGFAIERKFIDFVTTLLRHRGCTPLESFWLSADESAIFLNKFQNTVNMWIGHVLRCKVQALSIINHDDNGWPITLKLNPHPFTSLYLKRLHLCYVDINSLFLTKLLTDCPALEDLEMINCEILATEFSSATLKNLSIDYDEFPEFTTYEEFRDIVINMPSLVSLRIGSLLCPKLILVEVQSLVTASISLGYPQRFTFADACDILGSLPNVKNLELLFPQDVEGKYSLRSDMQLCQTVFTNLTTLSLSGWCLYDDCKVLLYMLKRSPNLETLTLKLKNWFPGGAAELKSPCDETTEPFHCVKLKKIVIICPKRNKRVGMLVTILFANIISPPEINIKPLPGYSLYEGCPPWYDFPHLLNGGI